MRSDPFALVALCSCAALLVTGAVLVALLRDAGSACPRPPRQRIVECAWISVPMLVLIALLGWSGSAVTTLDAASSSLAAPPPAASHGLAMGFSKHIW